MLNYKIGNKIYFRKYYSLNKVVLTRTRAKVVRRVVNRVKKRQSGGLRIQRLQYKVINN